MNHTEFQLRGVSDQRLAIYATSRLPAWLWSVDGTRVLWANPVGARLFGMPDSTALSRKSFGPADLHRRQVAQLANRLPPSGALRLQRLRGFGAPLGSLVACGCTRLSFCDGSHGILITVADPIGRTMPLSERLQRLVGDIDAPIAAFDRDGRFVGANTAAHALSGLGDLTGPGLDDARIEALKHGRVELPVGPNRLVIQRVGAGADVGLVALMATPAEPELEQDVTDPDHPTPDHEQPETSGEAPAELALTETPSELVASAEAGEAPPLSGESSPAGAPPEATPAENLAPGIDPSPHEPSPYIEPVADEPEAIAWPAEPDEPASPAAIAPPWLEELAQHPRRLPLRFLWQMDRDSRFSLDSEEFSYLVGAHTMSAFGRTWHEIAETFGLDPDGRVLRAFATHDTWSGITLDWPVDGSDNLPVELAGLPVFDRTHNFAGYRGFGVCRDLDGLARLVALRRYELSHPPPAPQALSADIVTARHLQEIDGPEAGPASPATTEDSAPIVSETSQPTDSKATVETPPNVVPFRPIGDAKSPALTPVENRAFNELARQLAERLERSKPMLPSPTSTDKPSDSIAGEPPKTAEMKTVEMKTVEPPEVGEPPRWLTAAEPPAQADSRRDRTLLDLLPTGILIYRLDRLLYANSAFLRRVGYDSLHALEDAGGLDALYVEPGTSVAGSSTSDSGTPVTISATAASGQAPTEARLHTISWDGDSALALICSPVASESAGAAEVETTPEPEPAPVPSPAGHANAEELATILDTTADGILMFDADGTINSCNRSAEALFGYDGAELVKQKFTTLFAPESQAAVRDYLQSVGSTDLASLLDHGRDVLARVRGGGLIPVSVTMGRTQPQSPNFFAMFRDLSEVRRNEGELHEARRVANRAANAKADMLARISHEVRAPLNAILGFAEVMIGERFGALGNERYSEYLKDIRASGERVITIIDDLLDLSRIETGKLDLAFASQNLNEMVESCVAVMQPQANRERIIIRTSLAHTLPPVTADAHALRQIMLNLVGNSIRLANAGGQVIVSTALSDFGDVVLRVRDTGHGMNDNEVAAALEPFRNPAPSDQAGDNAGLNLSLTKALVEANGAHFQIRSAGHSGTLIEVVFSRAAARA
ncbi:MAG TPA: PAS domain-containing protein [Bradyrhizobium sp.]|nr:PAS domain-containing protein [Bradyrhizobium sp.]